MWSYCDFYGKSDIGVTCLCVVCTWVCGERLQERTERDCVYIFHIFVLVCTGACLCVCLKCILHCVGPSLVVNVATSCVGAYVCG